MCTSENPLGIEVAYFFEMKLICLQDRAIIYSLMYLCNYMVSMWRSNMGIIGDLIGNLKRIIGY